MSFVFTQFKSQIVLFPAIQFSSIDRALSGATTPGLSRSGSIGNEGVFNILQNSEAGASPSYGLRSYTGHLLAAGKKSYVSARIQSVYSRAPTDKGWYALKPNQPTNQPTIFVKFASSYHNFRSVSIITSFSNVIYEVHAISFQTFFVWALFLIVHSWNPSPLRSNLLQLQCSCSTVPTTSGRPHRSPLVWACQWPSSQPLSSQLSHNDSLWA